MILKSKLSNSIRGIDIETKIEQFYSVILILKLRLWNANGDIDIETATVEYDLHYRTSNGFLKTSIAHPCCEVLLSFMSFMRPAVVKDIFQCV